MFEDGELKRLLEAISDPVRMRIMFLLKHQGRLNVGEITRQFHISRPAISHHLKMLKDADIVLSEKSGQEIYYWLNTQRVVTALRTLADKLEQFVPDETPPS